MPVYAGIPPVKIIRFVSIQSPSQTIRPLKNACISFIPFAFPVVAYNCFISCLFFTGIFLTGQQLNKYLRVL